ncbi:MAG: pyridoxamine 5'-phosphate oxidase family protein [Oscillospiraceae bacterium]
MRRKDRAVTSQDEIRAILEESDSFRLALNDKAAGVPYIVPLNYGYVYDGERLTLYFHSAAAGRKLDLIAENPIAGFELDCAHRLITGEAACSCSMEYQSIIGTGTVAELVTPEEKATGLNILMQKYSGSAAHEFPAQMLDRTAVFRLDASAFSAKKHIVEKKQENRL